MAKPICLIKIDFQSVMEGMRPDIKATEDAIEKKFDYDYHVIVIPQNDAEEIIKLEVFNADKIDEIEYAELKEIIKKHLDDTVPQKFA